MDIASYVEFKAKTLVRELSENWDFEKCSDLYKTLDDLLQLSAQEEFDKSGMLPATGCPIPSSILQAPSIQSDQKKRRTLASRGTQKAIIELILDRFFEGSKSGQTKFTFYAKDFGCEEDYFHERIA